MTSMVYFSNYQAKQFVYSRGTNCLGEPGAVRGELLGLLLVAMGLPSFYMRLS